MVQIIQAQPTAKTLRQQAFQQGLDQIGQGVVGFGNAMDQRTQREQALNIKAAEAMMRDGIEFTPENMQIIRSALSAQTPTGFSGLFPGLKSDEQKAAEAEQKKAEEEKAAAEAEAAAQNTQQGNVSSPHDGSQQIPNGNNFGMYNNMSGSVQQGNVQSPAFNGVQPGSANRQPSNMGGNVNINPGLNNQGYAQESQQRSPSGSFGKLTYTASKQAEMNRLKAQAEKDAYEARQLSLPVEQRDDYLKAVALEKAKKRIEAKSTPTDPYKTLSKDKQNTIDILSDRNAKKASIANQIDAVMKTWDKLTDDEKYYQGSLLLKTLNSPEGADAIGKEEAGRIGSNLEFAFGNIFSDNPLQAGRDLPGFKQQSEQLSNSLKEAIKTNTKLIDEAYGRSPTKAITRTQEDELKELEELRRKKAGIK